MTTTVPSHLYVRDQVPPLPAPLRAARVLILLLAAGTAVTVLAFLARPRAAVWRSGAGLRAARRARESGQGTMEYVGVIAAVVVVIALVAVAFGSAPARDTVLQGTKDLVCAVTGGPGCADTVAGGQGGGEQGGGEDGEGEQGGEDGAVTNYTVYDADGRALKRVDLTGRAHGGIPTPHVVEYRHNTAPDGRVHVGEGEVRAATPEEVP